jgi:DnaJ-class molecular chaperone
MIGTCDLCQQEGVPLARAWVTGIETFVCIYCNGACPECDGEGIIGYQTEDEHTCEHCNGTGEGKNQ